MIEGYAWFTDGNGRSVYRRMVQRSDKRSSLAAPLIMHDSMPETQSMADGRYYTSKSAMRRSYRADGNPQGISYIEVGNEDMTRFEPPKRDKAKLMESIHRAQARFDAGDIPAPRYMDKTQEFL